MQISDKTMMLVKSEQKCIGCKACMKGCPMLDKFCENPKDLLKELLDHGEYLYEMPYSCLLCGYCEEVCPVDVSFKNLFLELRRDLVSETHGNLPKEINQRSVEYHQHFSFSRLFTSDIQELQSDTVFFPGCALISYSPKLVEDTLRYLRELSPGIGYYNKCCGKPTRFMGDEHQFHRYYSSLDEEFDKKGIHRIITGCQNCFKTLQENSPGLEIISLWEYLGEKGIPKDRQGIARDLDLAVTLHDPCPTRDETRIHDGARKILDQLGLDFQEMPDNRERTLCCGSGGMVPVTQNHIAREHMSRRASEAETDHIVTYCQECVESMRRGGKKSWHLLDLIFNERFQEIPQENSSGLTRWKNRFEGKKIRL